MNVDSSPVFCNRSSTCPSEPRSPSIKMIFALIPISFKLAVKVSYTSPSQNTRDGFVILNICWISCRPNDVSSTLMGQPMQKEANTIGATLCEFFAMMPKICPGLKPRACKLSAARIVLSRISLKVSCMPELSLICENQKFFLLNGKNA